VRSGRFRFTKEPLCPFLMVVPKDRQSPADIRLGWLKALRGRSPLERRHQREWQWPLCLTGRWSGSRNPEVYAISRVGCFQRPLFRQFGKNRLFQQNRPRADLHGKQLLAVYCRSRLLRVRVKSGANGGSSQCNYLGVNGSGSILSAEVKRSHLIQRIPSANVAGETNPMQRLC
jgi:hypothetical protein